MCLPPYVTTVAVETSLTTLSIPIPAGKYVIGRNVMMTRDLYPTATTEDVMIVSSK